MVIESRINKRSSTMALLIPWIAIDPIQQRISGREHFGVDDGALAQDEMHRALGVVPVTLRAEVAAVDLPVTEILALGAGSVIRLGKPAERGVSLFAENTQLGHGVPGANGARRAVQMRDVTGAAGMTNADITPQEALVRLGASTGEAVAQVFDMYAPGLVERGDVTVLPDAALAFENLPFGAIAASVSYVDGVTGANVFVMGPAAARALAGAMGVPPPEEPETPPSRRVDRAHRARALRGGRVRQPDDGGRRERDQRRARPGGRDLAARHARRRRHRFGARSLRHGAARDVTSFPIDSETCRLIQLVPSAFVVRMARAIDELALEQPGDGDGPANASGRAEAGGAEPGVSVHEALEGITLRVWAELGRAQLPLGQRGRTATRRRRRPRLCGRRPRRHLCQWPALRSRSAARHR